MKFNVYIYHIYISLLQPLPKQKMTVSRVNPHLKKEMVQRDRVVVEEEDLRVNLLKYSKLSSRLLVLPVLD